jgi:hypothetical protein
LEALVLNSLEVESFKILACRHDVKVLWRKTGIAQEPWHSREREHLIKSISKRWCSTVGKSRTSNFELASMM